MKVEGKLVEEEDCAKGAENNEGRDVIKNIYMGENTMKSNIL